jgi:hypothetical protein
VDPHGEAFETPPDQVDAIVVSRALALLEEGRVAEARDTLYGALLAIGTTGAAAAEPAGVIAAEPAGVIAAEPAGVIAAEPAGVIAAEPAGVIGLDGLGEAEVESAFDDARPETDAMIDADGIAFEAMRAANLHQPEPEAVELPAPGSPFHTQTMADLLERQGNRKAAGAIRAALQSPAAMGATGADRRTQTIRSLERWLARLRGGDA